MPELESANHYVREQRDQEHDEQHPSSALERADDGAIHLKRPAIRCQDERWFALPAGQYVLFERPDPYTSRNPYHEQRKEDVPVPGAAEVLADDASHNLAQGATEEPSDDKRDDQGNEKGDEK